MDRYGRLWGRRWRGRYQSLGLDSRTEINPVKVHFYLLCIQFSREANATASPAKCTLILLAHGGSTLLGKIVVFGGVLFVVALITRPLVNLLADLELDYLRRQGRW